MTNLLPASFQAMNLLHRELEDVLDQLPIPFRMRREAEELIDAAPSPAWLWRAIDQMLEDYMSPAIVRRRVERVFDRAFTTFRGGFAGDGYAQGGRFDGFGPGYGDGWLRHARDGFGRINTNDGWGRINTNDGWSRSFNGRYGNYGAFAGQNGLFPMNGYANGQWSNNNLLSTSSFFPANGGFSTNGLFGTSPFFSTNGFATNGLVSTNDQAIPVEVIEREHDLIVRAGIPAREHDVDTRITNDNVLTIRAQLVTGNIVTRTIPLPRNVDVNRVQAIFHHGLLEVCVMKLDATRGHRVPVQRETGFRANSVGEVRSYVS